MTRAHILAALLSTTLPFAPTAAFADDIPTFAPVVAATLYPYGAIQTHRVSVEVPAGTHRILLPLAAEQLPQTKVTLAQGNAVLGALSSEENTTLRPTAFYAPEQKSAQDAVDSATKALADHDQDTNAVVERVATLQTQLSFVENISPEGRNGSVEALTQLFDLIGTKSQSLRQEILQKSQDITARTKQREELERDLLNAQRTLARLSPPRADQELLVLPITVDTAQKIEIELAQPTPSGSWAPHYDILLSREDSASLTLRRKFAVTPPAGTVWKNVDVTLTTAEITTDLDPATPYGKRAEIYKPTPRPRTMKMAEAQLLADEAPMVMPEVMAGMASPTMTPMIEGATVTYRAPRPVTSFDGGETILDLDALTFDVAPEIHAVPRRDATAFLVAELQNTTFEPLLPGRSQIYRDGTLIGNHDFAFLPAGDRVQLGFGPLEGIQLEHVEIENATGDRGIISTTNTRTQETLFRVKNLTGAAQEVKVFYPLTYSEQEDLEVEVSTTPSPNVTDQNDIRGLAVWDLSLAPKDVSEVTISTTLSWPDGYELNWHP